MSWDDIIKYADECIAKVGAMMDEYPQYGEYYRQKLSMLMWHKLQAMTAKKIQEDTANER